MMHIAALFTTDINGNPQTTFIHGNPVYYRAQVVDQNNAPVSGATVTTQVYRPDGSLWQSNKTGTTDASGWATFSLGTVNNSPLGTYTINITNVTKTGATYDPAANVTSSTTFVLQ
jgi:uncharacterized protein YfaS (alpha-2-macroglobulin family)